MSNIGKWFDPISERWIIPFEPLPEPSPTIVSWSHSILAAVANQAAEHEKAVKQAEHNRIWDLVVNAARATEMSDVEQEITND